MGHQVITDEKGKKKAVIVPLREWESIQAKLKDYHYYSGFEGSVKEIASDIKGESKLKNIRDLING